MQLRNDCAQKEWLKCKNNLNCLDIEHWQCVPNIMTFILTKYKVNALLLTLGKKGKNYKYEQYFRVSKNDIVEKKGNRDYIKR